MWNYTAELKQGKQANLLYKKKIEIDKPCDIYGQRQHLNNSIDMST